VQRERGTPPQQPAFAALGLDGRRLEAIRRAKDMHHLQLLIRLREQHAIDVLVGDAHRLQRAEHVVGRARVAVEEEEFARRVLTPCWASSGRVWRPSEARCRALARLGATTSVGSRQARRRRNAGQIGEDVRAAASPTGRGAAAPAGRGATPSRHLMPSPDCKEPVDVDVCPGAGDQLES
jgi:hypothetical protein